MADTPEALAEKVREGLPYNLGPDDERVPEAYKALDALLARLAEAEKQLAKWQRVADGIERACQAAEARLAEAEKERDACHDAMRRLEFRYKDRAEAAEARNLTDEEARIVLIGLDAIQEYGWDGAPYTNVLQSAIDKLEQQAGDLEQATVHPLQQKLEPDDTPFEMPRMEPRK